MKWTEQVDIAAGPAEVRAAIADEEQLMAWSAWPAATGYRCAVESGDGRSVGSVIVFRDDGGDEKGRQQLTRVTEDRVEYRLRNRGPFGRIVTPALDFRIAPRGPHSTRVLLDFEARLPLPPGPRHLIDALMGRRVRRLHVEDLRLLKAHVERTVAPS